MAVTNMKKHVLCVFGVILHPLLVGGLFLNCCDDVRLLCIYSLLFI